MGTQRFPKQTEGILTDRFPCFHTASMSSNIFHIHLKTAFFQGPSHGVNRDVVCQLPPEAGHLFFAARLKKPAYGINDAPRRWWNILDEALCGYGMVPTRADRCCYVLYSTQTCKSRLEQRALHRSTALMTSHLNRAHDQKEMQHLREC